MVIPRSEDDGSRTVIPELPGDYYLVHFQTLLETVEERYGDLLSEGERAFLAAYRISSESARRLFIRLSSRKGPLFRSDRLVYDEIPDLEATWKELERGGLLEIDPLERAAEACELLTVPELKEVAREAGLPAGASRAKSELLELVLSRLAGDDLGVTIGRRFHWLVPRHQEHLRVFRLLFFGSPEPDLTSFVLSDLGMRRFETYPLLDTHRLFTRREEIDRALHLRDLLDELYLALEENEVDAPGLADEVLRLTASLPPVDSHPLQIRWRRRFLEYAGRFWERRDCPDRALELYADPMTQPSRERRARLLMKRGELDLARTCCEAILAVPRDPEEEEIAESLLSRIACGPRRRPSAEIPVESLELPGPSPEPIETRVLHALTQTGRPGFIAENHFWAGLFGLLFWDIIYRPIPRAFGHPFQMGPTDLFTAEFRPVREREIQDRLAAIADGRFGVGEVVEVYRGKAGLANALVAWDLLPISWIERAMRVIPPAHLVAVFDRLSRNLGGFKTGFPDLFLFVPEPPGYLLAEVKSPNDRLQNNQKSWMRWFARHGIPFRLVQVAWASGASPELGEEPGEGI